MSRVKAELESLSGAASRQGQCAMLLVLAEGLDNPRALTSHASLARQLREGLKQVRDASVQMPGKLATVAAMTRRP